MKEITYEERISRYSLDELLGVEKRIDKNDFPDRYNLVLEEIEKRKTHGDPVLPESDSSSNQESVELSEEPRTDAGDKKPILVWVIFIWFTLGGLFALYNYYSMYTGNTEIPEGFERPEGILYYLYAFGTQFYVMAAAALLFMRQLISKWLFSILCAFTAINSVYSILLKDIPSENIAGLLAMQIFTLVIYGLITWYSFSLEKKGYFGVKST